MDSAELGERAEGAVLDDPAAARQRAGSELKFRASGGAGGVAPMQRLLDERRAMSSSLAGRVQRKADGPAANAEIPEGGGAKLPSAVRARMEPKLGANLSDVSVHTGGDSAKAATGLGARAFTVGNDVHFNAGEFAPGSKEGDRLLAHELTHVVQGKKSGVQRKPEEGGGNANAGGGGGAAGGAGHDAGNANGNEVSHPDEPAEKEADAVADGVTDSLHGDKGGHAGGKKGGKHKDERSKEGEAKGDENANSNANAAAGAHGAENGNANANAPGEKPAPISAKLVGVSRKIFRAKGDSAKPDAKPSLKIDAKTDSKADPPLPTAAARDPGAWAAYDANWSGAFLPKLKENGVAESATVGLAGKKSGWFDDAYNAVESGKDYHPVVDRIFTESPKEPGGQDKHFWSGGAPAQGMADQAIKDKGKAGAAPGAAGAPGGAGGAAPQKAMRLETSHVGILFNGVFNQPPSKLDWAKQAIKFWQRASTNYAKATTGTVTAHLNVDFKYAKDQKVNRGAIFGQFELPEIVTNMKTSSPDGKTVVSSLVLDLWVHGATKDAKGKDKDIDKKLQFNMAANPAVNEQQILDAIDAQIQVAVNT